MFLFVKYIINLFQSMAAMYAVGSPKSSDIEITEENLPQFVWEMMRYFGGVPSIPYIKGIKRLSQSRAL